MKISRPPSPITRAAARAPRNAPVRFTSRTWRQTDGVGVRGARPTIGEMPGVADPHVDAAPLGDGGVGHRLVEVLVGDVAAEHQATGPGSASATALRSRSVRATRATDAPARRERVGEQRAEAAAGAGDHHPLPRRPRRGRGTTRGSRSARSSRFPSLYRPVQYTSRDRRPLALHRPDRRPRRDAPAHAAHPRVRAAGVGALPRRRGARASCTSRSGRRRRPSARAGRCGPPTSSPPPTAATATAWPRASTRSGCSPS